MSLWTPSALEAAMERDAVLRYASSKVCVYHLDRCSRAVIIAVEAVVGTRMGDVPTVLGTIYRKTFRAEHLRVLPLRLVAEVKRFRLKRIRHRDEHLVPADLIAARVCEGKRNCYLAGRDALNQQIEQPAG